MPMTVGPIALVSKNAHSVSLTCVQAANVAAPPVTYQWSRSTDAITYTVIASATTLFIVDTGLIPNTTYYYRISANDANSVQTTALFTLTTPAFAGLYAFKFYSSPDGLALMTGGLTYEWGSSANEYITPLGLATHGLAVSEADFWRYTEVISTANWVTVDL